MADVTTREVRIPIDGGALEGFLTLPQGARGIVVFAHGSGSSRFSRRNQYVASVLQGGGLATLLFDLLTPSEEAVDRRTRHLRFDIEMLSERLAESVAWLSSEGAVKDLPVGLFGSSTGAAAALIAATYEPEQVLAVVSRGGRPDLAGDALQRVVAPTLLIVGGNDAPVIRLNEQAMSLMNAPVRLEIVPGATHLFEEPGTLEQAASLARDHFVEHLVTVGAS